MMKYEDFIVNVKQRVYSRAEAGEIGSTVESFFLEVTEMLDMREDFEDIVYSYFERVNYRIDGYAYSETDRHLYLFVVDLDQDWNVEDRLGVNNVVSLCNKLENFVKAAKNSRSKLHEDLDDMDTTYDLVQIIKDSPIYKYRFMILTNRVMTKEARIRELNSIETVRADVEIWDLERLYSLYVRMKGDTIDIDFRKKGKPIPCLRVKQDERETLQSYLAVVEGKVLADLFLDYGVKLLESNVRDFLGVRTKVNKGIVDTVRREPENFFAYNNGIACTAKSVKLTDGGERRIEKIEDFQIINGGQTTATLAYLVSEKKRRLEGIYVPMKITVVDKPSEEESLRVVRDISKYSNSQNPVTEIDFFSSSPFHTIMKQHAEGIPIPKKNPGQRMETHWYYEGKRGAYTSAWLEKPNETARVRFQTEFPSNRVFRVDDIARMYHIRNKSPHIVCCGRVKSLKPFIRYVNNICDKELESINEVYYKEYVAMLILERELVKRLEDCEWNIRGRSKAIAAYTIAAFLYKLDAMKKNETLDLQLVWSEQSLPDNILQVLVDLSEFVTGVLYDQWQEKAYQHEFQKWIQGNDCWLGVQAEMNSYSLNIDDSVLVHKEDVKRLKKESAQKQKDREQIGITENLYTFESKNWESLQQFAKEHNIYCNEVLTHLLISLCTDPKYYLQCGGKKQALVDALYKKCVKKGFK